MVLADRLLQPLTRPPFPDCFLLTAQQYTDPAWEPVERQRIFFKTWQYVGDAARFVIFAFAAGATYPVTAFLGGAAGGAVAVVIGWSAGHESLSKLPLRWIRLALGVPMIIAALFIGLNARYTIA